MSDLDPRLRPADLPVPVMIVRDGFVADANVAAAELCGLDLANLIGWEFASLVEPRSADAVRALITMDSTATDPLATRIDRDGRPIELRSRPSGDGSMIVVLRDTRDERRLVSVIDELADSTFVLGPDGLVRWQSEALAERITADGTTTPLGINPMERVHPEDLPRVLDSFARAVTTPGHFERYTVRSRAIHDDDLWQVIEVTGASALDQPDLEGIVVQVRNLDEGEIVDSVATTEGRLQSLADAAPIGIVVTNRVGQTVYRNRAAVSLLGQTEVLHTGVDWRDAVAQDSRVALDSMVEHALMGGHSGTATVECPDVDDGPRWLRVNVVPRRTGPGDDVVGTITTLEDVTAEFEARAATERLTHMLDATTDYVAVFRPDGELLYANEATRFALDRLRDAGGSGRLRELIDDEMRLAFVREALAEIETSDIWRGELTLNIGPGQRVPVSALGVVRRDPNGGLEWIAMLGRDISEVKAAEERLRRLATRDSLTGLANRSLANDRLELAVARHRRTGQGTAVFFCDLDGFKPVNDEHGHAVGDEVLVVIANRLSTVTRAADTVARVGGDEFVLVVEGLTDVDELAVLAERIIEAVSAPVTIGRVRVQVGISVGIALAGPDSESIDADRLLTIADTAMYRAKATGGNRYRLSPA